MSSEGIVYRRAGAGDVEALARLFDAYRVFYKQASDEAGAKVFVRQRLERGESVVFLAERDGRAIGFVQLYPIFSSVGMGRALVLNDLYVEPGERGLGAGRGLMAVAEAHAREAGAVSMSLLTAHDNSEAQRLYAALGWKRDEAYQRWVRRLGE